MFTLYFFRYDFASWAYVVSFVSISLIIVSVDLVFYTDRTDKTFAPGA